MLDDRERLRAKPCLLQLLTHYAKLGEPSRETWQDRLMALEGVQPADLSKLHGELIAFSLIDQNTGNTDILRAGAVPGCYRITLAGLRALQQVNAQAGEVEQDVVMDELSRSKRRREKRQESDLATSPV